MHVTEHRKNPVIHLADYTATFPNLLPLIFIISTYISTVFSLLVSLAFFPPTRLSIFYLLQKHINVLSPCIQTQAPSPMKGISLFSCIDS